MVAEKVAEIKFAGEIQLAGNVLDRKPLVREQQPRLIQPRALDVLVDRALAAFLERGAQAGIADLADDREFLRLPVAEWICRNRVEHAHHGRGQFGVWRGEKFARHQQLAEQFGDAQMHLPFPADGLATDEPEQFTLHRGDETKIIQREFRVVLAADFLVPEFQSRPAETEAGDGKMFPRRRNVGARLAHVREPDFFAALQLELGGFIFQFAFARLHPEQMRARFFKTLMPVHRRHPPRADGKQMPQQPSRDGRGVNELQIVGGDIRVGHGQIFSRNLHVMSTATARRSCPA